MSAREKQQEFAMSLSSPKCSLRATNKPESRFFLFFFIIIKLITGPLCSVHCFLHIEHWLSVEMCALSKSHQTQITLILSYLYCVDKYDDDIIYLNNYNTVRVWGQ